MTSLPEHVQPDEEADVSSLDGADRWWCREVDAALTAHPAVTGLDATDRAVATRHPAAFPASFRQTNPPAAAADDIVHLLRLRAVSGDRTDLKAVRLHRRADDREDHRLGDKERGDVARRQPDGRIDANLARALVDRTHHRIEHD